MRINILGLLLIGCLVRCQDYFPPSQHYCSQEAFYEGKLWHLYFPQSEGWYNRMTITHVVDHDIKYARGLYKNQVNSSVSDKVFVEVDADDEQFTKFAEKYGLTPGLWRFLLYDPKNDSVTIRPNSSTPTYELKKEFC